MKGNAGRYRKPDGREEVRIHFALWVLDGVELQNVTVFPHQCGSCVGGDHTHVELNDVREPFEVIAKDAIDLEPRHRELIDDYLRAKLSIDRLTLELCAYLPPYGEASARKGLFTQLVAQG